MSRVPFFLEPNYNSKPEDFTEPHNTRMVRKFGSMEQFDRVKRRHGLIPRGKEVGLDEKCGFHQNQLDKRIQSSTMNSHRLILYVAEIHGLELCEQLYDELNRRHFIEGGILNDRNLLEEALRTLELPAKATAAALNFLNDRERGRDQVLELVERVNDLGIHSIPTLVVDGQYMMSGAARSDAVLEMLTKAVRNGLSGKKLFDIQVTST